MNYLDISAYIQNLGYSKILRPYFFQINWASVASGSTSDLSRNLRNNTGHDFLWTSYGLASKQIQDGSNGNWSLSLKTTQEEAFSVNRINIGALGGYQAEEYKLPIPFLFLAGIEMAGTAENLGASTDTLYGQLTGILLEK